MTVGTLLISEERNRQILKEGFTISSDAQYQHDELTRAALVYLLTGSKQSFIMDRTRMAVLRSGVWPFDNTWYKPRSPITDLTRAGALIAARLDVMKSQELGMVRPQ